MTTSAPAVTVAVVVRDRPAQLARCLAALAAQTTPHELLVVDNASTDDTPDVARRAGARVVVQPGLLGRVRQAAVDACRTELLAFTDSDCQPDPGWLAALLAARAATGDAVVQGRTVPVEEPTRRWSATQRLERFTDLYEACNLLYHVETLRAAGGFDTSWPFFGEDTVAGWRVRLHTGRPGSFAPDAVVRHDTTYPGPAWHVRRGLSYAAWPALVRAVPEIRGLLGPGPFLRPRSVAVDLAAAGVLTALATRRALPLLAAVPYVTRSRPRALTRKAVMDAGAGMLFDGAVLAGLVRGSVKERRAVL